MSELGTFTVWERSKQSERDATGRYLIFVTNCNNSDNITTFHVVQVSSLISLSQAIVPPVIRTAVVRPHNPDLDLETLRIEQGHRGKCPLLNDLRGSGFT